MSDTSPNTRNEQPTRHRRPLSRRAAVQALTAFAAMFLGARFLSGRQGREAAVSGLGRNLGNFEFVFSSSELRAEFKKFLIHVFHLYPEDAFDLLIAECVAKDARDPAVYRRLENRLVEIAPLLSDLRYSLPALRHQKEEMERQTALLLTSKKRVDGYLEIGSHGRYFDALSNQFEFVGPVYTCAQSGASHSPADIVDRGAIELPGIVLPWTDYEPVSVREIPDRSLELVTVFIGLHHAKPEQRVPYASSLARVLKESGRLIIRDHDVRSDSLRHIVSLAHDVFNVGTQQSWHSNELERRNFYSIDELCSFMGEAGLVPESPRLLQPGDPTKNTLLSFRKV